MKNTNSTVTVEFNTSFINTLPKQIIVADRYEMDEENDWLNIFDGKYKVASVRLSSVKSVYLNLMDELHSVGMR